MATEPVAPISTPAPVAAAPVVPPVETPPVVAPPPAAAAPVAPVVAPVVQPPAPVETPKVEAAKPATPPVAPEAIKIKPPEGSAYDPTAIGELEGIFANEKLTPSQQAQAVVDLDHKHAQANAKKFADSVQKMRTADIDALKADKDFGGGNFDKTVAQAASAVKQFGGEEFSKLVTAAGLDVNPAFVKTFARIRQALKEDDTSSRLGGSGVTPPAAKALTQTEALAGMYSDPKVNKGRR